MNKLILVSILIILFAINTASAGIIWADTTEPYMTVNQIPAGTRPYVLNLTISNAAGANTASQVFMNGHGRADFGDVRFYLDNATPLNYYNDSSGHFWVNVTGTGNVNIYYGNPAYTTLSSGNSTFIQFTGTNTSSYTMTVNTSFVPVIYESHMKQTGAGATEIGICGSANCDTGANSIFSITNQPGNQAGLITRAGGVQSTLVAAPSFTVGTYYDVRITAISGTDVRWDATGYAQKQSTTNIPTGVKLGLTVQSLSGTYLQDYAFTRPYAATEPTWATWGAEQHYVIPTTTIISPLANSWWNRTTFPNFTWSNVTCLFCDPLHFYIQYSYSPTFASIYNETNHSNNIQTEYFNVSGADGTIYLRVAVNDSHSQGAWSPTVTTHLNNSGISLISPANGSTQASNNVVLQWVDTTLDNSPYNYQLATDYQFINVISTGSGTNVSMLYSSSTLSLSYGQTYYWRARNGTTATYSDWFNFTISPLVPAPSTLNITARDEINFTQISNFTVQLYNTTTYQTKSTVTGWVNFTASEVVEGQYLAIIIPNNTYAQREILVDSPGIYIAYLPSTSYTIDTIAFYLLDYTNKYPFIDSTITISKGGNTTQSAFFDADAKNAVNLIRGNSYVVTVANSNNNAVTQWGNYISTGSGNVEVVIMNLGVNETIFRPYSQNINSSSASIDVTWNDTAAVLNSVNITVFKNDTSHIVYNLVTSVSHGTASYIITDTTATYITQVIANTTQGTQADTNVLDLGANTMGIKTWTYGGFTMPTWVKNAFGIIIMFMLAGSFGAIHRGEGAVITGIWGMLLWWWDILSLDSVMIAILGSMVLFAVFYHLANKAKAGGYF